MAEDAVPCAWAVGTNVLLQEVDRLKKVGIAVTSPAAGSRKRPDGMAVEWKTAGVGSGTPGSVLPFIIEDETPRAWRVQASASVAGAPVSAWRMWYWALASGCIDCAVPQGLWMVRAGDRDAEGFWQAGVLSGRAGDSGGGRGWVAERVAKYGECPVAYLLATHDFAAASKKYKLSGGKTWFGQKVAWFDAGKLKGVRVGVIGG